MILEIQAMVEEEFTRVALIDADEDGDYLPLADVVMIPAGIDIAAYLRALGFEAREEEPNAYWLVLPSEQILQAMAMGDMGRELQRYAAENPRTPEEYRVIAAMAT